MIQKTRYFILYIILLGMVVSCDKETLAPIDQLPPATQTGADIFACLVDGQAFIDTSRSFNCFYQWIDGDYFLGLGRKMK